ncbi:hypothetical protein PG987_016138 [Apiospora arundinis]
MASEMRVNVANELLRDSTCRRRKANQDVICDRVEAWHHDPKNKRKIPEIDEACCEIAKLRDVIIPDIYWLPDLQETLKEQLYAIYSAIDMLKARSFKDVELFGRALGEARNGYADPGSWPCDIDNEHMEIMLAVVELAITKAKRSFGWPPNHKLNTCFGRVAEALEQAFLYRKRGLKDISPLTSDLFRTFNMIYEAATVALQGRMSITRDLTKELESCGSTLGEGPQKSPRSPRKKSVSSKDRTKKRRLNDAEGKDTTDANRHDGEVAVKSQSCGCRYVLWKAKEVKKRRKVKAKASKENLIERVKEGYNPYRRSVIPFDPSPLGQFVETPSDETQSDGQRVITQQHWVDCQDGEEDDCRAWFP